MNAQATPIVAYYRVSTAKQGVSGLGMEAQAAAVQDYAARAGSPITATFREVESGRDDTRPELAKAIAHARRIRGVLVVAKLDRLARSVAFLSALMESRITFVACDNPNANSFTVHILAAVAEHEAKMISTRTKAALHAAKVRGVLLGAARPGHIGGLDRAACMAGGRRSAELRSRRAAEGVADLIPIMQDRQGAGDSLAQIATALNAAGHTTSRGNPWGPMAVMRAMKRAGVQ